MALESVKDAGFRLVPRLHRALLATSRGRLAGRIFGMPVLELHTIGRKTGQERVTVLTAPIINEQQVVLVASKGGDDRHPTWYLNLVANPDVKITVNGKTRSMRARVTGEAEKAELWPKIVATYKGYADYQKRTSRDIPVIVCEPAGG